MYTWYTGSRWYTSDLCFASSKFKRLSHHVTEVFFPAEEKSVSNGRNQDVTASFTSASVVNRLSARCHHLLATDIWHLFLLRWDKSHGATVGLTLKPKWWLSGGLICIHWNQNKILGISTLVTLLFCTLFFITEIYGSPRYEGKFECVLLFSHFSSTCVFLRFSLASVKHGKLRSVSSECDWG